MLIYCYINKEIYINRCFVDVMKIHPTKATIYLNYFSHNFPISSEPWIEKYELCDIL